MIIRGKSRPELFVGLCLSIVITLVVLLVYLIDGFEWLERRTYDLRVQYRGTSDLHTSVLMIENDESTITNLGIPPSKVSRAQYARAVSHLSASGARLIVFDMLFSGTTDAAEDAAMSQAIEHAGNVILARYIGGADHVGPLHEFQVNELGEGLINLSLDMDGVLRSIPFLGVGYVNQQMRPFITLGAEAARLHIDPAGEFPLEVDVPDVVKFGSMEIPYPQGNMLINFSGPPGTFPSIPLWRIVQGKYDTDDVKGKIVLVGGTAATLHDYYQTPFGKGIVETLWPSHASREGRQMAGLEVHANVVQTVLDQSFVHRSSPATVKWLIVMLGMGCWIFIMVYPNNAIQVSAFSVLLLVLLVILSVVLFNTDNYWLDVVPFISLVNAHYGVGMAYQRYLLSRQKEQLRSMFSQYMSPDVVEHLWNERVTLKTRDARRSQDLTVTTLAVGFEEFSDQIAQVDQERIVEWTNSYFDEIGQIIIHYRGIVEDYAQDGMLVHYGIPVPHDTESEIRQDAQNAVRCALAIHTALEKVNTQWKDEHLPLVRMHAGVCTGRATTTTIGGPERLKFTTLGEPVRTALRLKRLASSLSENENAPNIFCEAETVRHLGQCCITKRMNEFHSNTDIQSSMVYQVLTMEPVSST